MNKIFFSEATNLIETNFEVMVIGILDDLL